MMQVHQGVSTLRDEESTQAPPHQEKKTFEDTEFSSRTYGPTVTDILSMRPELVVFFFSIYSPFLPHFMYKTSSL